MDTNTFILELAKILASIAIPMIALLRTRTDLDRIAASQRALTKGTTPTAELRKKWYHGLKPLKTPKP